MDELKEKLKRDVKTFEDYIIQAHKMLGSNPDKEGRYDLDDLLIGIEILQNRINELEIEVKNLNKGVQHTSGRAEFAEGKSSKWFNRCTTLTNVLEELKNDVDWFLQISLAKKEQYQNTVKPELVELKNKITKALQDTKGGAECQK
jgi:predicted  nucleic acid-binding Zn-ribbon protein